MNTLNRTYRFLATILALAIQGTATAGDVEIVAANLRSHSTNHWSVNVTLLHEDAGWDHYADNWRMVDSEGDTLGERVLFHPHVNEKPFSRGLSDIEIPADTTTVYIEAHDKVHGWTPKRLKVDISHASSGRLTVKAE